MPKDESDLLRELENLQEEFEAKYHRKMNADELRLFGNSSGAFLAMFHVFHEFGIAVPRTRRQRSLLSGLRVAGARQPIEFSSSSLCAKWDRKFQEFAKVDEIGRECRRIRRVGITNLRTEGFCGPLICAAG